jgi:Domain of unknown function (DUF4350)
LPTLLLFFLLVLAGTPPVLWASAASARPFDPNGTDWEGCSDFLELAREQLGPSRVIIATSLDFHELRMQDGLILIHPERSLDAEELSGFMRAGGRVVQLDDFGTGDALLQHFGIRRVPLPRHPAETLRHNPELAIATPAAEHQVVRGVSRVMTNHATGLLHPDLSPVLEVRGEDEPPVLVAEAGAVGHGRFLAVGDPSIVINSMLRYPGNRTFAKNLLVYATDDDAWGKRQGRVFFAIGDFTQRGSYGTESSIGDDLNAFRRAASDALESVRREGMPPMASYVLSALIGLAVILWVGARAGRTHRPSPPRFTRPVPLALQGGVAGHAAVIGARTTTRTLAVLELKSALEEGLASLLGHDQAPAADVLLQELGQRGLLGGEELVLLRQLLVRMANVETAVLSRSPRATERVRDPEVLRAAAAVRKLLRSARDRAQHRAVDGKAASA